MYKIYNHSSKRQTPVFLLCIHGLPSRLLNHIRDLVYRNEFVEIFKITNEELKVFMVIVLTLKLRVSFSQTKDVFSPRWV
jgi:hypothetical protein